MLQEMIRQGKDSDDDAKALSQADPVAVVPVVNATKVEGDQCIHSYIDYIKKDGMDEDKTCYVKK